MKHPLLLLLGLLAGTLPAADYTLGTLARNADRVRNTTAASDNPAGFFPVAAAASPTNMLSATSAVGPRYALSHLEAGFAFRHNAPEYYLADALDAPADVDWYATHANWEARGADKTAFIFDAGNEAVYTALGGEHKFVWVKRDGTVVTNSYTVAETCQGRPRRLFCADANPITVDLSGKHVAFFGDTNVLSQTFATVTNVVNGQIEVTQGKVIRGLCYDESSQRLCVYGSDVQGNVVMVYYDTNLKENILAVQVVTVCRETVEVCDGTLGEALEPKGDGYPTEGLIACPETISTEEPQDGRGPYVYQHAGAYPYSPKNGAVFPLRPTTLKERMNVDIWWKETDAMAVQWPFVHCQYVCSWPTDPVVYVRDPDYPDFAPIWIPSVYTATLCDYQETGTGGTAPADGQYRTTGEGFSMLRLTGEDNVWFVPVKSVLRNDATYFNRTNTAIEVGHALTPRGGSVSGLAPGRAYAVDVAQPGALHTARSGTAYAAKYYAARTDADETPTAEGLPSAVFAVNVPATANVLEMWWMRSVRQDAMPSALIVPCLPQLYHAVWPAETSVPKITLASQQGGAAYSRWSVYGALVFDAEDAALGLAPRRYFPNGEGTLTLWTRAAAAANGASALLRVGDLRLSVAAGGAFRMDSAGGSAVSSVPADPADDAWHKLAVVCEAGAYRLYVDGVAQGEPCAADPAVLGQSVTNAVLGAATGDAPKAAPGREVSEIRFYAEPGVRLGVNERQGTDGTNVTPVAYYSFRDGEDLVPNDTIYRLAKERVTGLDVYARNVLLETEGAPLWAKGTLASETAAEVYFENDVRAVGYNPNEEHAFVRAGDGGYVPWALRCDLNTAASSRPAVLVHYSEDGRAAMRYYAVCVTNEFYPALAGDCTAGALLPGPHPLDTFPDPWLAEDAWLQTDGVPRPCVYRDRKRQLWARCPGRVNVYMHYAVQEGFFFPDLAEQPAAGTAVPWLARLDTPDADVLKGTPHPWNWTVSWPTNALEMAIGQTLTTAAGGLPEVWDAASMAVVYPLVPAGNAVDGDVVRLFDPVSATSVALGSQAAFEALGFSVKPTGDLTLANGRYRFNNAPPSLADRLYVDASTWKLCLEGKLVASAAGASVLYVNRLSEAECASAAALGAEIAGRATWETLVQQLAGGCPAVNATRLSGNELITDYTAVTHYALAAMGATNYVVLVENDATNAFCDAGNPVSMKVLRVVPRYYAGRTVTREDPNNVLSQQLDVRYTESFAGSPDAYEFEWRYALPSETGGIPAAYDDGQVYLKDAAHSKTGMAAFTIGERGDTLDNLVNKYYVCRYRAAGATSPAWKTMGDAWSAWCAPPALAEGWLQRCLNNITPYTQRMQDLANNEAETVSSLIAQAGPPYEGDVALNSDNLDSVGLIQLYQTLLNKAETLSIAQGIDDAAANKQLLQAVERLAELYTALGDEAYADALNPTIGFGFEFEEIGGGIALDYGWASSSLFCFDNQVRSLLDEELALLRGRTGTDGTTHASPCYNRLYWNFTRGLTAGEMAYAVNYDISGSTSVTLGADEAAADFPQGHGDAYGHYLSALAGWYRLLRHPHFSWGKPSKTEMNVADSALNVDYYDEAKFAEAAVNVAKTAARIVDLTGRAAWRDNGCAASGYFDSDPTNAFGYGEVASRGGYGAFVNWAVANSLLPADRAIETNYTYAARYTDHGLSRIDRGTVDELAELCEQAAAIARACDRLDAGLTPIGLSTNAVPFDITPIGVQGNADASHYEQIAARAKTAAKNAHTVLDRAQTYASRLRLIKEVEEGYDAQIAAEEADCNAQLIAIFGKPYADDIGPNGTYGTGYDGPDLYHYMWMDLSAYGLGAKDTVAVTNFTLAAVSSSDSWTQSYTQYVSTYYGTTPGTWSLALSASGLVVKPDSVTGTRPANGSLQLAYADFLAAYAKLKDRAANFGARWTSTYNLIQGLDAARRDAIAFNANAKKKLDDIKSKTREINDKQNDVDDANLTLTYLNDTGANLLSTYSAAGIVKAAAAGVTYGLLEVAETTATAVIGGYADQLNNRQNDLADLEKELDCLQNDYDTTGDAIAYWQAVTDAVGALNDALTEERDAFYGVQTAAQALSAIVEQGNLLIQARTRARTRATGNIAKVRYNDAFFRKVRNAALSRYATCFDIAQKYAYLAAKAYDYETGLLTSDAAAGSAYLNRILGERQIGCFTDGEPDVAAAGDAGLAGILAEMRDNFANLKGRLGINNPQEDATWFSLRRECFRVLDGATGDAAWRRALANCYVADLNEVPFFKRLCQPFLSSAGPAAAEPALVIPFSTAIDHGFNFFGRELAGGDSAFDTTYYATKIAAAGVWLKGYSGERLAKTPLCYLVPAGEDRMRVPGVTDGSYAAWNVVDQVVPLPYAIGSTHLDDTDWFPSWEGDAGGADAVARIRKYPSFRAGWGDAASEPTAAALNSPRLVGRSVWNAQWYLVIPAGAMGSDREKALDIFVNGLDTDRDGTADVAPVGDILIGFKTYSHSGN